MWRQEWEGCSTRTIFNEVQMKNVSLKFSKSPTILFIYFHNMLIGVLDMGELLSALLSVSKD